MVAFDGPSFTPLDVGVAPTLPLNGSWSIGSGVDLTPITQPDLAWNFAGTMALAGYIVQLDTQSDFASVNALTYTSWNDAGFDVTNKTFSPQSDLDDGKTWYWRVRAVSATNQIGNWSSAYHFQLPDPNTVVYNATKASVELRHHGRCLTSTRLISSTPTLLKTARARTIRRERHHPERG